MPQGKPRISRRRYAEIIKQLKLIIRTGGKNLDRQYKAIERLDNIYARFEQQQEAVLDRAERAEQRAHVREMARLKQEPVSVPAVSSTNGPTEVESADARAARLFDGLLRNSSLVA